jgi:hypothetical protein
MMTETHTYLCLVPSDRLHDKPLRAMPDGMWNDYIAFRLRENGFDMSTGHKPINRTLGAGNCVFAQEIAS